MLIAPTFLYQFRVPCRYCPNAGGRTAASLDDARYVLPSFGELEGKRLFAELRGGWSEQGVAFSLQVVGKRQSLWCRDNRIHDSDGLQIWLDTRDTHNVHRASQFCHQFVFLPEGAGRGNSQPLAEHVPINRARAISKPAPAGTVQVRAKVTPDGYTLDAWIGARALTGFDPPEHPRLGFFYAVIDRELGTQTFSVGEEYRYAEDPSVWGTLELTE